MALPMQADPNSVQGVLQQLLGSQTANRQQATQRRDTSEQAYRDVLDEPMPDSGPVRRMVGDYLMRYSEKPTGSWNAAAGAIGSEVGRTQKMDESQLARRQTAASEEVRMAGADLKEDDAYSRGVISGLRTSGSGKQPSPEQLRVVYTSARNEAAQIAKDHTFVSAEERSDWIEQQANKSVQNYIQNFATTSMGPYGMPGQEQPSGLGQPGLGQPPQQPPIGGLSAVGQPPQPAQPGQLPPLSQVTSGIPQIPQQSPSIPGQLPVTTPQQNAQRNLPMIQSEMARPDVRNSPDKQLILKQELEREQGALGNSAPTTMNPLPALPPLPQIAEHTLPGAKTPMASPVPRDRAEEGRKKEFATKMEGSAIKDFEEVKNEAAQSAELANTVGIIRQIPRTQDAFAPWREKLGSAMNAIGMDGTMVQEAQNIQQVRPMLNSVVNKILNLAKGPQTDQDAKRAYGQFLQITDTQKAVDFIYTLTEEMAQRAQFKRKTFEQAGSEKGSMQKGHEYWNTTDYAKTIPVGILGGKAWGYTSWRDQFMKANPDATSSDVTGEWNRLTRGGK